MIPRPEDPEAPKYWIYETQGVLGRVIRKYLAGTSLCPVDISYMRAYFRQWANSPAWDRNPHRTAESERELAELRRAVDDVKDTQSVYEWVKMATRLGMDPL